MDRGDQAEIRLGLAAVEQRRNWRAGLLFSGLYLFRFTLLASPFVFTHASSVPRVAEFTPDDFKLAARISGTMGVG